MPDATDATDAVTEAIQTLFRLGSSRRIHQQQAAAAGVAISPLALRVLEWALEAQSTTPGELAARLDLDPGAVTRLLRQLEDAGLVVRSRSSEDGRVSTVAATDAGRQAFGRFRDVIWDQVRRSLSEWQADDLAALADLLARLVHDVQEEPYRSLSTPSGNVFSNVPSR